MLALQLHNWPRGSSEVVALPDKRLVCMVCGCFYLRVYVEVEKWKHSGVSFSGPRRPVHLHVLIGARSLAPARSLAATVLQDKCPSEAEVIYTRGSTVVLTWSCVRCVQRREKAVLIFVEWIINLNESFRFKRKNGKARLSWTIGRRCGINEF